MKKEYQLQTLNSPGTEEEQPMEQRIAGYSDYIYRNICVNVVSISSRDRGFSLNKQCDETENWNVCV